MYLFYFPKNINKQGVLFFYQIIIETAFPLKTMFLQIQ